jgi:putative PIN family toxin of toxin-antitoxin system
VNLPKVVIDTNVFVSGLFFSGPPFRILKAWQNGQFRMAVSEDIIDDYKRVIETLAEKLGDIDLDAVIERLVIDAEMIPDYSFEQPVCEDPDDDKFLACAMLSKSQYLVSGDKHLLKLGTFLNTEIVTPRQFLDSVL